MSSIKDNLFWERFRPKKIEQMILLPRIKSYFYNEDNKDSSIQTHVILHGNAGTGKSTLTRILLKDAYHIELNNSIEKGIDILREKITDFCTTLSPFQKKNNLKYVFLDEFDGSTGQFQEALKAYMEQYNKNVRFIATANNIADYKIIPEIKDRFKLISFDPQNYDEEVFLKKGYMKYLKSVCKSVKLELEDDIITKVIEKNFPSLRSAIQDIQSIFISGNKSDITESSLNLDLYTFILDNKVDIEAIYNLVMGSYMDRCDLLLKNTSIDFLDYLFKYKKDEFINHGRKLVKLSKEYNAEFQQTMDPVVHLVSYITEIKEMIRHIE